jgi:uncharacterized membrane protein
MSKQAFEVQHRIFFTLCVLIGAAMIRLGISPNGAWVFVVFGIVLILTGILGHFKFCKYEED